MQAIDALPNADLWYKGGDYVPILMVDNDEFKVRSTLRAVKTVNSINPIVTVHDGPDALNVLHEWLSFRNELPPSVILLDLSMPKKNGLEFLDEIRTDPVLRPAHFFIYSSFTSPSEIITAYALNVAGYVIKGCDKLATGYVVKLLGNYIRTVHLAR